MSFTPRSNKLKPPRCRAVITRTLLPVVKAGVRMGVPKELKNRCENYARHDGLCTTHAKMRRAGKALELADEE